MTEPNDCASDCMPTGRRHVRRNVLATEGERAATVAGTQDRRARQPRLHGERQRAEPRGRRAYVTLFSPGNPMLLLTHAAAKCAARNRQRARPPAPGEEEERRAVHQRVRRGNLASISALTSPTNVFPPAGRGEDVQIAHTGGQSAEVGRASARRIAAGKAYGLDDDLVGSLCLLDQVRSAAKAVVTPSNGSILPFVEAYRSRTSPHPPALRDTRRGTRPRRRSRARSAASKAARASATAVTTPSAAPSVSRPSSNRSGDRLSSASPGQRRTPLGDRWRPIGSRPIRQTPGRCPSPHGSQDCVNGLHRAESHCVVSQNDQRPRIAQAVLQSVLQSGSELGREWGTKNTYIRVTYCQYVGYRIQAESGADTTPPSLLGVLVMSFGGTVRSVGSTPVLTRALASPTT